MAAFSNSVDQQVFFNIRIQFDNWLGGGPDFSNRYVGDDGRPLYLDEYPFWPAIIQVAAAAEWTRLQDTIATERTAEQGRRTRFSNR